MRDEYQTWFYLPAGGVAAIVLGMLLAPFRELTHAGNFVFAFVILIVVVAELGGRWAAITTAALSALSLDFFLTRPYLRLSMEDKHDFFAFAGLAICGLVAAAIGSRRGERIAALQAARSHVEFLHHALREATDAGTKEARLTQAVCVTRDALPLAGAVLRDAAGCVLAASSAERAAQPRPVTELDSVTLLPKESSSAEASRRPSEFPAGGARLPLLAGDRRVGWLEVWGNGSAATPQERRALADAASLLTILLDP